MCDLHNIHFAYQVIIHMRTALLMLFDSLQRSPDRDFIIDKHPQYKNIMIGVGFSG